MPEQPSPERPNGPNGRTALTQVDWKSLPAGAEGDPSAPTITLEYARDAERFRYVYNARGANVLPALQRALSQVDDIATRLLKKPCAR